MESGVYCIQGPGPTYYIGSSWRIALRLRAHRNALRRGGHHNGRLQNAWRSHGEAAFRFYTLETTEGYLGAEQRWLDMAFAWAPRLYNAQRRAMGPPLPQTAEGQTWRERVACAVSEANRARWSPDQQKENAERKKEKQRLRRQHLRETDPVWAERQREIKRKAHARLMQDAGRAAVAKAEKRLHYISTRDALLARDAERRATPEGKAKQKAYNASPEAKARQRAYNASPEGKAKRAAYKASDKYKQQQREYHAARALRKKDPRC